MIDLAK